MPQKNHYGFPEESFSKKFIKELLFIVWNSLISRETVLRLVSLMANSYKFKQVQLCKNVKFLKGGIAPNLTQLSLGNEQTVLKHRTEIVQIHVS